MNKPQLSQIIVLSPMLIGAVAAIVTFVMTSYSFVQSYLMQAPVIVYNRGLMLGVFPVRRKLEHFSAQIMESRVSTRLVDYRDRFKICWRCLPNTTQ